MNRRRTSRLLASAVLLTLVLSFIDPLPAWADDGAPPPESAPPEVIPTEAASALEASPPAPDEAPPALAEPLTELPPDAAALPAELSPSDEIVLVPEGTTIAVVGAEGDLLPLVSEVAAEAIAVADPVWCPASVKAPTPESGGCSPAEPSMADLLTWLVGNEPATDGIIWIQGGAQADASPIVFDGAAALTTMSQYRLTLRGGWDGTPGSRIVYPDTPSVFGATLAISDWHNDVTLSDLVVDGTTDGVLSYGLDVSTSGNISLTRVEATNNQGTGAWLDNSSSTVNRSVAVKDGNFDGNSGDYGGLLVLSRGKITLTDLTASNNHASSGAFLDNSLVGSIGGVTLSGTNVFEDNAYGGLVVASLGVITVNNLTASGNGTSAVSGTGAELTNNNALTPMAVKLTGTSTFADNLDRGLYVYSRGAITAGNLNAVDNGSQGVSLNNTAFGAAGGVTLSGTSVFTGNSDRGLDVHSLGAIKLSSIIANSNGSSGAVVYNGAALTAQPVSLTGTNSFKYNGGEGLSLRSNGAVTANSLNAVGNIGLGVNIENSFGGFTSNVTLTGMNAFIDNGNNGLRVVTWGGVALANLTASRNGGSGYGWGVDVYNAHLPGTKPVMLTGRNVFDANYSGGLEVLSAGPISASNLTASRSSNGGGVYLSNVSADSAQKVTLSGVNRFDENAVSGLEVNSFGPVSVSNLTAGGNTQHGVVLRNDVFGATSGVTVSGTNQFTGNGFHGLDVISFGAISANNLTATGNGLGSGSDGVRLENYLGTGAGIKLTGTSNISGNASGLVVYSTGAVSLATITASGNTQGSGAYIDSTYGGMDVQSPVTLTGTSIFDDNYVNGLLISTYGAVTLGSVSASNNGLGAGNGNGLDVANAAGTLARPVTLNGSYLLNGNEDHGLYLYSKGAVKVNNLTASNNGSYGAWLYNYDGLTQQPVSLTGSQLFEGNFSSGLYVISSGAITAANLTARGNAIGAGSGYGAHLANDGVGSVGGITLTGINLFTGNRGGVNVLSTGPISVSNLTASGSTQDNGADLRNSTGLASSVTLSGTAVFEDNWNNGLHVTSTGPISLNTTSLQAIGNGVSTTSGEGVRLYNAGASTPQKIILKGTGVFKSNLSYGLDICSTGPITASNITANGSLDWGGASLSTTGAGASGSVTLSGVNVFLDNHRGGLSIDSSGPITVNNLTAQGNGIAASNGYGASLSNNLAASPQSIQLTGVNAVNDNYWGLHVSATGPISVSNLTASGNTHSTGAVLDNTTLGSVGGVTLTGSNTYEQNYFGGLLVQSLGAITANNLRAQHNGLLGGTGIGVYLTNAAALTPQAIQITGTNSFVGNQGDGLTVSSAGTVTANNLTARGSITSYGVFIDNDAGTADVTLTGTNLFGENADSGLWIESHGVLSLTSISADGNGGGGLFIQSAAGLTLTCGSFTNNALGGLAASTTTMPVLIGVVASGNGSSDLWWSGGAITGIVRACPLD